MKMNRWVDDHLAGLDPDSRWRPDVAGAMARFRELSPVEKTASRKWTWAAAVLIAAGVCVMAFPEPRTLAQHVWEVMQVSAADRTLKDGQPAPDFILKDATGGGVRLSAYKGKVVLLNFWATWCGGCKVEIPWCMEFADRYKDRGLAVIGVSMDDDGWKSVKPFVEEKKMNYPVVLGNEELAKLYGLNAMPMTFLIDRGGRIAALHIGVVDKGAYESEIVRFLGKAEVVR